MSKKNFIQVFEYQKLRYSDDSVFRKHHFEAMVRFNEKNQNLYFTVIHKGVQFNSYVGIIQIGGLTIEILPKADNNDNPDENLWQGVLLNMLRVCKHINVDNVSETALRRRYNSILEVYFEMYLNEVEKLIKRGLIKQYRRVQNNQLALKGKLVFTKNIQKNVVHRERFYCEHQVYDRDHIIHQILLKALKVLDNLSNSGLRDKLNRVLFEFRDFKDLNITSIHFEKLSLNRKSTPYQKALGIAKMLILNYAPNLNVGNDNMLTLLFDMNKLWEEYIYRKLAKLQSETLKVKFQNRQRFWETKLIKPDIVVSNKNKEGLVETFIIDTKWKIIDPKKPSDDDLKQMYVYNMYWQANKSMLLYPSSNPKTTSFGTFHKGKEGENKCKLGFINVLDSNNNLDQKIGQKIIQQLEL